jgi:hypothetical protein
VVVALTGAAFVVALAGCAPVPSTATVSEVAEERLRALEAENRSVFDEFIDANRARFDELELDIPQFQGLVSADTWGDEVAACVERINNSVSVAQNDGGLVVSYFGVVGDRYDRIRLILEGCSAQYGVLTDERPAPGPVEIAWLYDDTVTRLMPCLRGLGISPPSPPTIEAFARSVAGGEPWNPVDLAVAIGHHERVTAVCPSSPSELERRMPSAEASS